MDMVIGILGIFLLVIIVSVVVARSKPKNARTQTAAVPASRAKTGLSAYTSTKPHSLSKRTSEHSAKRSSKSFGIRWFGEGSRVKVGGLTLKDPHVYASSGDQRDYLWATDPSEILLSAPVRRPTGSTGEMGYWPWYSRIEPEHRFEYLSWIASGRDVLPPNDGFLFLYFYGIERRLLVDETDRAWALQEITRLRKLDEPRAGTKEGRSFRMYSTGLLWFEIARTPSQFAESAFNRVVGFTERWTPDLMTAPLAWLVATARPLPTEMARQIASADPAAQRSVVTKRIPEKFNELFETRYRETFGDEGMTLKVSKRPAWHTYRPASGGLDEMRVQVPNPMGIRSQFRPLPEIWNSCIADLRKLSRVSASHTGGELTAQAWEAMPDELRADTDHPLTDSVTAVLARHAEGTATSEDEERNGRTAMVTAGQFAEIVGIERRPKLTATQSRKVAETLEHTGYGLVPDARLTPIRYRWDDLVAVVPGLNDDDVESKRYNAAACVLRLGLSIALADGEADELELRMLTDHLDAVFDLSPDEQQRLSALRDLLLRTGGDIRPIARKIQEMLPPDARRKVGRLLVVIAAATNGIDRSERAALRKAFRALGLPPELLEETIAEITPEADEREVSVRAAGSRARPDELISQPPPAPNGFSLNHAAISSIMSETREVSVMLAEAMGAADAESDDISEPKEVADALEQTPCAAGTPTVALTTNGIGKRYEPLLRAFVLRDVWEREEADAMARSHGLMLDAGVETINDWAYEALGAPLIEDEGERLVVERSLLDTSE